MKTLYIECSMGPAGDMLAAAVYELLDDKEASIKKLNSLGIPGVVMSAEPAESSFSVTYTKDEDGEWSTTDDAETAMKNALLS